MMFWLVVVVMILLFMGVFVFLVKFMVNMWYWVGYVGVVIVGGIYFVVCVVIVFLVLSIKVSWMLFY